MHDWLKRLRRISFDPRAYPRTLVNLILGFAAISWLTSATVLLDPTQMVRPNIPRITEILLGLSTYVDDQQHQFTGPSGLMAVGLVLLADVMIGAWLLKDPSLLRRVFSPPGSIFFVAGVTIWVFAGIVLPLTAGRDGVASFQFALAAVLAVLVLRAMSYPPPNQARRVRRVT